MQPQRTFLTANTLRYHLRDWNPDGHKTLLCLHGFLEGSWTFLPIAESLANAGYRVIAPDLRGHGHTDRVGAGGYYHFFDYLFDIADLLDVLGCAQVSLIGHSMGGGISSYFAGIFPQKVENLVIMEGISVPDVPPQDTAERVAQWVTSVRLARKRIPRAYPSREAVAQRLQEMDPHCPEEVALSIATEATKQTDRGFVFLYDPVHLTQGPYSFRLDAAQEIWKRIQAPTLFLEGHESNFQEIPDLHARYACFQNHKRVQIPRAGHMMLRHNPEAILDALLAFLGTGTP